MLYKKLPAPKCFVRSWHFPISVVTNPVNFAPRRRAVIKFGFFPTCIIRQNTANWGLVALSRRSKHSIRLGCRLCRMQFFHSAVVAGNFIAVFVARRYIFFSMLGPVLARCHRSVGPQLLAATDVGFSFLMTMMMK